MYPKIRQLEYLNALVKHKSFVKAARACNVTQSTLSAGIKELEELLGHCVIERSVRKFSLTAFGLSLYKDSLIILDQADNIIQKAQRIRDPMAGPLHVGIIPTIAPFALPNILPLLEEQYPKLNIALYEDYTNSLIDRLEGGELDIALIAFPYKIERLAHKILKRDYFVTAIAKGQMMAKKSFSLEDLKNQDVLLLEDGHCLKDHTLTACSLSPKSHWKNFRTNSLPTLIELVRHGHGITLLPEMAANSAIGAGIDLIPFEEPRPYREIGMIWRSGSHIAAISQKLSEVFEAGLNKSKALQL